MAFYLHGGRNKGEKVDRDEREGWGGRKEERERKKPGTSPRYGCARVSLLLVEGAKLSDRVATCPVGTVERNR